MLYLRKFENRALFTYILSNLKFEKLNNFMLSYL